MKPEDVAEATDYKAHSAALHLTPCQMPIARKGLARHEDQFAKDMCFWEMFEHGRRLVWQIHQLKRRVAPRLTGAPSPRYGLKAFRDGWQRTQEMQAIFFALVKASSSEATEEGDATERQVESTPAAEASRSPK